MNFELLASKTKYFKQTDEGVKHMCKLNEEMVNEAKLEAEYENSIRVATKMISDSVPIEKIADYTDLTFEEINELATKLKQSTTA